MDSWMSEASNYSPEGFAYCLKTIYIIVQNTLEFVTWKTLHEYLKNLFTGKGDRRDPPSVICPQNGIQINIATISNNSPSNCLQQIERTQGFGIQVQIR